MDTQVQTPLKLLSLPQYLQVPLFQRLYIWNEDRQWQPLWQDVRRLTELRMQTAPQATHFLGAVVMQQHYGSMGNAEAYSLVDGQQRLTTLELLIDATDRVCESLGFVQLSNQLKSLTHNSGAQGFKDADQLKIQHSNDDWEPFQLVMLADRPIDYAELDDDHLITRAHRFFTEQVQTWLDAEDSQIVEDRANGLAATLMSGLELVVITLKPDEDSQAIFETLNARGTPLTQADLVKNLVFERLEAEGIDVHRAYSDYWRLFDQKFWTAEVRIGQYSVPRASLFFNHWLVAQTGEEISTQATFSRFKHWIEYETKRPMLEIVKALNRQAVIYQQWVKQAAVSEGPIDPSTLFVYRTQAAGFEAVKPILLWLYDPDRGVPHEAADAALRWLESWILRRALLRRSSPDVSRTIAELVAQLRQAGPHAVADRTRDFLARLDRPGTYWPPDHEIQRELEDMAAYRAHPRGRLRLFLEAFEDDARGYASTAASRTGSRVPRNVMHIEHVLPRRWATHWPVESLQEEVDRDAHVDRLGNLTLLTRSLNSQVSNGPWRGANGKQEALLSHDVLLMNRKMRDISAWDEDSIDQRTRQAADALIRTWPVPEGHDVEPVNRRAATEADWIDFREVVAAGIINPGTVLYGRGDLEVRATVTDDGKIAVAGQVRDSPSGAGKLVLGHSINGWQYWRLSDGRRLAELKPEYRRMRQEAT